MKNTIYLLLIICLFFSCTSQKRILESQDCSIFSTVIKDIMKEDKLKEIKICKELVNWNRDIDFDFTLVDDSLPKTQEEREKRLTSVIIDPYPMFYVFAYPCTDTLFSPNDREFMKTQIVDTNKSFKCNLKNVIIVDRENKAFDKYAFYPPVFNQDYSLAIIRVLEGFKYYKESKIHAGTLQTIYYRYDKQKGWIRVFASGKWL